MSKAFFFSLPAHGHTNPTLAVVRELIDRGDEVIYYNTDSYRAKIESVGAVFRPYPRIPEYDLDKIGPSFIRLARLLMQATQENLPRLLEHVQTDQPDYLIHDSLCVWGKYLAQVAGLPGIAFSAIFAFNTILTAPRMAIDVLRMTITSLPDLFAYWRLRRALARAYRVAPPSFGDTFSNSEPLNIITTSRQFQPQSEAFDDTYAFVGPTIAPRADAPDFPFDRLGSGPLIYISMGTVFNKRVDFYRMCFQAFGGREEQIVLSVGRQIDLAELGEIPDNFIVKRFVPQLDILQRADLFITHGGMNSVHEGLYYGVPLVAIPQMAEQAVVARRIQATGAGLQLRNAQMDPHTLRVTARRVLEDLAFRQCSAALGESLKAAGGYRRAVDEIFAFKAARSI